MSRNVTDKKKIGVHNTKSGIIIVENIKVNHVYKTLKKKLNIKHLKKDLHYFTFIITIIKATFSLLNYIGGFFLN